MRDFLLTAAEKAFREDVKDVLARELAPRARRIEANEDWQAIREAVSNVGSAGYLKLMFADLYSGPVKAPGITHATILSEEAAYLNYAFETTIASALSCAVPLHRYARSGVVARHLAGIVNGATVGAICVTEAGAGSDTSGLQTRIRLDKTRGEWVVDGLKRYISNASVADIYLVYGISDENAPAGRGMSCVVVPSTATGLSFPRQYHFMGRRGCIVGEVAFEDCRVPEDHLLGDPGSGHAIMTSMLNFERVILGGAGLGVARSAFDTAVGHAQRRVAFGEALSRKELIWNMVAEMSWRIDAAELLTYRAARLYDSGADGAAMAKPAAMAKLVAAEAANYCADTTVQILGGDGLTKEYGRAEQIYRDARALKIVGGTSEMVKYLIAGRDMPETRPKL